MKKYLTRFSTPKLLIFSLFLFAVFFDLSAEQEKFFDGTTIENIEIQAIEGNFGLFGLLSEIYFQSDYADWNKPKAFAYIVLYNKYHNGILFIHDETLAIKKRMSGQDFTDAKTIRHNILMKHNAKAINAIDIKAFVKTHEDRADFISNSRKDLMALGKAKSKVKVEEINKLAVTISERYSQLSKALSCDWRKSGISDVFCRYNYFLLQAYHHLNQLPNVIKEFFADEKSRAKLAALQWTIGYMEHHMEAADRILIDLYFKPGVVIE